MVVLSGECLTKCKDAQGPGISLQFARNVAVTGNTIIRPMSGIADNQNDVSRPIDSASAIFLDVVGGGVNISGNLVIGVDVQSTPKVGFASHSPPPPPTSLTLLSSSGT